MHDSRCLLGPCLVSVLMEFKGWDGNALLFGVLFGVVGFADGMHVVNRVYIYIYIWQDTILIGKRLV